MWIKLLVWLGVYSKPKAEILQLIKEYKAIRKLLEKDLQDYGKSLRGFCACIDISYRDGGKICKLSDAKHLIDTFHEHFPKEYDRYYRSTYSASYWFLTNALGTEKRIFLLDKTLENLRKLC